MKIKSEKAGAPRGLVIRRTRAKKTLRECAAMMALSEPWVTLQMDIAMALETLSGPARELYVARMNGALAGHVLVNMAGPFAGYIQVLAVAPEWRSRGVGAELIRFAERRIFRDSPNVFLCVSGFNAQAQKFYARMGFERIGELKDYVIRGESEFLMRKSSGLKREFIKTPRLKKITTSK